MAIRIKDRLKALAIDDHKTLDIIRAFSDRGDRETFLAMLDQFAGIDMISPSTVDDEGNAHPVFLQDEQKAFWLPLYTSVNSLPSGDGAPKSDALTKVPFLGACQLTMQAKIAGIIVNPFSEKIVLQKILIEKSLSVSRGESSYDEEDMNFRTDKGEPIQEGKVTRADEEQEEEEIVIEVTVTKPDGSTNQQAMTESQFNYFMRQQVDLGLLAKAFLEDPQDSIRHFTEGGVKAIDAFYESCYRLQGGERFYPYLLEDFDSMALTVGEDLDIVRIDMPQKYLIVPCAKSVFLTWDRKKKVGRYFSVEIGKTLSQSPLSEVTAVGDQGISFHHEVLLEHVEDSAELSAVVDILRPGQGED